MHKTVSLTAMAVAVILATILSVQCAQGPGQPGPAGATQPHPSAAGGKSEEAKTMAAMAGAYYFDGWAGQHHEANNPGVPWARNAPPMLRRRMVEQFADREPVWGWRDDSLEVMERQIDLAADNGLAFFAFCWYWHDNGKGINAKAIEEDPKHSCLQLFLQARNNSRMKFCLLVANHQGFEIKGTEAWKQAAGAWMPLFKDPRHVTVGGKPLVIIFNPKGGDKEGFDYMQQAARKEGLPGVAIACCGNEPNVPMGYTHKTHYNTIPGYFGGSEPHPYSELVAEHEKAWGGRPDQPYMPTAIVGWDKRPWEDPNGAKDSQSWYFDKRTPEQFATHIRNAIAWMDAHPDQTTAERILLIYAWNELGEGGFLLPTKGDPDATYLKALKPALQTPTTRPKG